MTNPTPWLITAALAGLLVQGSSAQAPREAGKPKGQVIMRFYTGPDGNSHIEDIDVKYVKNNFKMMGAAGAELHDHTPSNTWGKWAPSPRRYYMITTFGHGELEVSDRTIVTNPGDIVLFEDTTGKGHRGRVPGPGNFVAMAFDIADQPATH